MARNRISLTRFVATICDSAGIPAPAEAAEPFGSLRVLLDSKGISKAEKLLIYNPDAIGMWLWQRYTEWFGPVMEHTQLTVPLETVMPSVTPVCFGTMYTGVLPEVHGILRYEKHLIRQESLFDMLADAGLKTAVVAVQGSSMSVIFGGRNVDYYFLPYDQEVNDTACRLLMEGGYDVLVVYNQEYDDTMHRTFPESQESLGALRNHIAAFDRLCRAADKGWKMYDRLFVWATDHGIHTQEDGHGNHGCDIDEDMNIVYFFGVQKGEENGIRRG